jgi:hypothetical protein
MRNADPMMSEVNFNSDLEGKFTNPIAALLSSWTLMLGDFDMEMMLAGQADGHKWIIVGCAAELAHSQQERVCMSPGDKMSDHQWFSGDQRVSISS